MKQLGCTRFDVAKLLTNFSRKMSDIEVSFRYEFPELFRASRQGPAPSSLPLNFVRNLTRVDLSMGVSWNPISALGFTVEQWGAMDEHGQAKAILQKVKQFSDSGVLQAEAYGVPESLCGGENGDPSSSSEGSDNEQRSDF